MKLFVAAALLALLAACSDAPTAPVAENLPVGVGPVGHGTMDLLDPVIVVAEPRPCDPYTQPDFSCGEDDCAMSTGTGASEFQGLSGCPGPGTGPGGGGTSPGPGGDEGSGTTSPPDPVDPVDPFVDGPLLFGQCFLAMLGVLAGTAALLPTTDGIYQAAREVDSAERMLQVVIENGGDRYTQALWEFRVESAKNRYNDSVGAFAIAAGFTGIAVGGAAVACLPAALLPTP
jgi:hypothetical protein